MYIGLVLFFSSSVQNLPTQDCDGPEGVVVSILKDSCIVLSQFYHILLIISSHCQVSNGHKLQSAGIVLGHVV